MQSNAVQKAITEGTGIRALKRGEAGEIRKAAKAYKLRDWTPSFNRYVPKENRATNA